MSFNESITKFRLDEDNILTIRGYFSIVETVDRDYQQKRLNKINKPIAKQAKDLDTKMFQQGSYHPDYPKDSIKHGDATNKLDRIKTLKTLSKARGVSKSNPDDESLGRKRDNAVDAAYRFHRSR